MHEGLCDALVCVFVLRVFSADADGDLPCGVLDPFHEFLPVAEVRPRAGEIELLQDELVDLLFGEHERHLVDGRDIAAVDDAFGLDVGKERDFFPDVVGERPVGPADQHVGLNSELEK